MIPFSAIIQPSSIAFTSPTGRMINVGEAHSAFNEMKEVIKKLQAAMKEGRVDDAKALHQKLADLAEPAKVIIAQAQGKVQVVGGVVYYNGKAIHNAVTNRIIWGLNEGFEIGPYVAFLENLMQNPSKRAVDELYTFLEQNNMGITEDGHILAYKRVREDYKDIYSGKVDHSVGQKPSMERNEVDDDKDRTCSTGYHFCSMAYLPHFGTAPGNRIMIMKVNPRDVVSIPRDYNNAKARCCTYEVIGEYEGSDKDDLLASKPVWRLNGLSSQGWTGSDEVEDWDDEHEDDEDQGDLDFNGGDDGVYPRDDEDNSDDESGDSSDNDGLNDSDVQAFVEGSKAPPSAPAQPFQGSVGGPIVPRISAWNWGGVNMSPKDNPDEGSGI